MTPCPESRRFAARHTLGARQEVVVIDETRHATDDKPGNTPADCRCHQGQQKPWRRAAPSSPKTVRHPTDAARGTRVPAGRRPSSDNRCSGKRPTLESSPAPTRDGPSCASPSHGSQIGHGSLQDSCGAIRHRDQPPKQNENPVRHSLNLAHPLVLVVSSRTRRILAIHYAPAFPAGIPTWVLPRRLPEAPQLLNVVFPRSNFKSNRAPAYLRSRPGLGTASRGKRTRILILTDALQIATGNECEQ